MYSCVLVTGGAGFVGSAAAVAVKESFPRAEVIALDSLRRRGSEINLPRLQSAGVRFIHGDVRCAEDLELPSEPDLLIECSAEASVLAGYQSSPRFLVRSNLAGCLNCLELARRTKADFIFLSTSRVYPVAQLNSLPHTEEETRFEWAGELPHGASAHGIAEEFSLEGPRSLYGMTKLAGELAIEEYADAYGFRFIINRCGLLTGPGQFARSDQGVVAFWVMSHLFDRPLKYIGFGGTEKQVRDLLHIDDFTDLLLDQLANFDSYQDGRYNVGGGREISASLLELTELCRRVTGKTISVEPSKEQRPGDLRVYISDSRRVSRVNGWRPSRGVETTVEDLYRWLSDRSELLRTIL